MSTSSETLKPFSNESKAFLKGSIFEHYKGMQYEILGVARHSETLEEMVVYQALYVEKDIWIRPLSMFLETIEYKGKIQTRFKKIS